MHIVKMHRKECILIVFVLDESFAFNCVIHYEGVRIVVIQSCLGINLMESFDIKTLFTTRYYLYSYIFLQLLFHITQLFKTRLQFPQWNSNCGINIMIVQTMPQHSS